MDNTHHWISHILFFFLFFGQVRYLHTYNYRYRLWIDARCTYIVYTFFLANCWHTEVHRQLHFLCCENSVRVFRGITAQYWQELMMTCPLKCCDVWQYFTHGIYNGPLHIKIRVQLQTIFKISQVGNFLQSCSVSGYIRCRMRGLIDHHSLEVLMGARLY